MRALLGALAVSAAYPGAWATFAPRSFFDTFPGAGRHWTFALPAYSEHLVTDVGAFYLGFALRLPTQPQLAYAGATRSRRAPATS